MENEFPIPVNFTTIALGILAVTMIIGAIRGIVRMFFGLAALAVAVVGAWFWYQRLPEVSAGMEEPLGPRVVAYSTLIVGVLAFIVARWFFGLIAKPFTFREDGKPRGGGLFGALLGLIPAAGTVFAISMILRLVGTSESMAFVGDAVETEEGAPKPQPAWMERVQSIIESDPLANLLEKIDPFIDRGRAAISELLVSTKDETAEVELQADPRTNTLLNHPKVRELLDDPEIREILARGDYTQLFQNQKVAEAARAPELQSKLDDDPIGEVVDKSLFDESGRRKKPRWKIFGGE
ncbi:MAG: CvpA family protein [Verrucomicrobiota bacterium]